MTEHPAHLIAVPANHFALILPLETATTVVADLIDHDEQTDPSI